MTLSPELEALDFPYEEPCLRCHSRPAYRRFTFNCEPRRTLGGKPVGCPPGLFVALCRVCYRDIMHDISMGKAVCAGCKKPVDINLVITKPLP